jgi:site-specific DNA-methyltransferase (adenine-specific)
MTNNTDSSKGGFSGGFPKWDGISKPITTKSLSLVMSSGSVHFSSQRLDWQTPDEVFKVLDKEFEFMGDPCPPNYASLGWDGLTDDWWSCNFVNPPYGREIGKWLAKGYAEYQKGKTVVFLIPSRTDTKWWHDYVMKATEIRFIKGRLKFKGAENNAPFPSAIVVFRALKDRGRY